MSNRGLMERVVLEVGLVDLGVVPRSVFTMPVFIAVLSRAITGPSLEAEQCKVKSKVWDRESPINVITNGSDCEPTTAFLSDRCWLRWETKRNKDVRGTCQRGGICSFCCRFRDGSDLLDSPGVVVASKRFSEDTHTLGNLPQLADEFAPTPIQAWSTPQPEDCPHQSPFHIVALGQGIAMTIRSKPRHLSSEITQVQVGHSNKFGVTWLIGGPRKVTSGHAREAHYIDKSHRRYVRDHDLRKVCDTGSAVSPRISE
jgi:hypothetical protein